MAHARFDKFEMADGLRLRCTLIASLQDELRMIRKLRHAVAPGLPAVILTLAAALSMNARPQDYQLPSLVHHISGQVVDDSGNPIAGANIDHSYYRERLYEHYQSAADGRFSLDTRAPLLVVRRSGFQSAVLHTETGENVTVTLHRLSDTHFPPCSDRAHTISIEGWDARLRFEPIDTVAAKPQGHDVDYGYRIYYLKHGGRKKPAIMHGAGPMWGPGSPFDEDVWASVTYDETVFDDQGAPVIDARGEDSNHRHWRSIGLRWGETVVYRGADEALAREFDRFLDGACITPIKTPPK
jgi:hypothetical protein